jgi:hypothetical protein
LSCDFGKVVSNGIFAPISKFILTFEMGVFFLNSSFYGNFIPIIVFHIITFYIYPFSISRPNKMDPKLRIVIFKIYIYILFDYISPIPLCWPFIDFLVSMLSSYFWKGHKLLSHGSFQQNSIMLSNTNISLRYGE